MRSTPKTAIVTGSGGLIGSETCRRLVQEGFKVYGVDNDMRQRFFGPSGSTFSTSCRLEDELGRGFSWRIVDIRDEDAIFHLYRETRPELTVHLASQPSHDRAAKDPKLDFTVNANGTLNLLEAHRRWVPNSTFIFTSTSKVYGTHPNELPLVELETRYDLDPGHPYYEGITPEMSVDQTLHSLFGVSKLSADLLCQEYANYFRIPVGIFRPGCLTGADHAGVELHGFLSYLGKCVAQGLKYKIYGYGGKQVRDNIASQDLVSAFLEFHRSPKTGAIYNVGGGRENACSVFEAIRAFEDCSGKTLDWELVDEPRVGDHKWFIGSGASFEQDFPSWSRTRSLPDIYQEITERFC